MRSIVCEFAGASVSKAGANEFRYYSREQEAKR